LLWSGSVIAVPSVVGPPGRLSQFINQSTNQSVNLYYAKSSKNAKNYATKTAYYKKYIKIQTEKSTSPISKATLQRKRFLKGF